MLGSAIADAVADDPAHTDALSEVWSERKLSCAVTTEFSNSCSVSAQLDFRLIITVPTRCTS